MCGADPAVPGIKGTGISAQYRDSPLNPVGAVQAAQRHPQRAKHERPVQLAVAQLGQRGPAHHLRQAVTHSLHHLTHLIYIG